MKRGHGRLTCDPEERRRVRSAETVFVLEGPKEKRGVEGAFGACPRIPLEPRSRAGAAHLVPVRKRRPAVSVPDRNRTGKGVRPLGMLSSCHRAQGQACGPRIVPHLRRGLRARVAWAAISPARRKTRWNAVTGRDGRGALTGSRPACWRSAGLRGDIEEAGYEGAPFVLPPIFAAARVSVPAVGWGDSLW